MGRPDPSERVLRRKARNVRPYFRISPASFRILPSAHHTFSGVRTLRTALRTFGSPGRAFRLPHALCLLRVSGALRLSHTLRALRAALRAFCASGAASDHRVGAAGATGDR